MNEWISVKERRPKSEGSYLVATKNGGVMMAHFYPGENGEPGIFNDIKIDQCVTDWRERPQHPKDVIKTNADKIRSMTDEELGEFLHQVSTFPCEACCNNINRCRRNNAAEPVCKNHYLDWLKEERS